MKKTVSINIKGINFMIEEDAYELLQDYMDRLNTTFKNEDGSIEIIEDIELRIAEICSSKLTDTKTVIELNDIEEILATLGNPEDYLEDEDDNQSSTKSNATSSKQSERRLFRDPDNAAIAGVCMGIANFFNIDVVIVRAIFVVIFLFAGFGVPLYIILWIIVPKAKTSIDKLRMKGRPITVESVRDEVDNAADKIKSESRHFARKMRRDGEYHRRVSRGSRVIASIIGIGFLCLGLAMLVFFLIFGLSGMQFIPAQSEHGFLSLSEFGALVLTNSNDYSLLWLGGALLTSSIILFFLLLGSMMIFRLKNKWSKLSLLGLFLIGVVGFILCATVGMRTGRDFVIGGEIERKVGDVNTKELVIIPNLDKAQSKSSYSVKSNGKFGLMEVNDQDIVLHGIHFEYVRSTDSLFHIKQNFTARSHTHKNGLMRCQNIDHGITIQGDSLIVDTEYSFPKTDKLRDQEVYIIVEIPDSAQVRFDNRVIKLGPDNDKEDDVDLYYDEDGYLKGNGNYRHYEW